MANLAHLPHPYFTQTKEWSEFWLDANGKNHYVYTVETGDPFPTLVYQYPWYFGQNFLYVPSGPVVSDMNTIATIFDNFGSKIKELAVQKTSTFIKLDLAPNIETKITESLNNDPHEFVNSFLGSWFPTIKSARKRIMYLSAVTLNTEDLLIPSSEINHENLILFFEQSKNFWKKVNSGHRAKTKKSLGEDWKFSLEKSETNFEHFWNLYSLTAKRQRFTTQPKEYFHKLYKKDESMIIVLFGHGRSPEAVWFGLKTHDSIIYLYGGNTTKSMSKFGQYYIHLIALYIAKLHHIPTYDLGGYDPNEGYGVFKERYKGDILNFGGPFDLILQSAKYNYTETAIKLGKKLKNFI